MVLATAYACSWEDGFLESVLSFPVHLVPCVPDARPWEQVSTEWANCTAPPYPLAVMPTVHKAQAHTTLNSVHKCPPHSLPKPQPQ